MRDQAVTTAALYAYRDALQVAPAYVDYKAAMTSHSYGVEYDIDRALHLSTGLTACREQHFALNRIDYYTVKAMLEELCKFNVSADLSRLNAAKWQAYFDNADRNSRANAEDDARCALAEAHDYRKVEDCHR